MSERHKHLGRLRPSEVVITSLLFLFLLAVMPVACRKSRFDAFRIECSRNLSEIGRAMLSYASDYDAEFPCSGGPHSFWAGLIPNWRATNWRAAYGIEDSRSRGECSISSCFYLLVKYGEVLPKVLVCKGDSGTTEFKPAEYGVTDKRLGDLWDFGPSPFKHCSYSYHQLFSLYRLTTASEPGMALAADRNPWIPTLASRVQDWRLFNPDGGREAIKAGNSISHLEEGQNVLFVDSHVNFEERSFCGMNDDNIYTFWDGGDIRRGGTPVFSEPQDKIDSLLVHDPPMYPDWPPRPPTMRTIP